MGIPIPSGYNFNFRHIKKDYHYSMPSADVYGDSYGIGYVISGNRMIITPGKTVIVHPGTIQFMGKDLYHRTTFVSKDSYENMGIKFRESVAEHMKAAIGEEQFAYLYDQISLSLTPEAQSRILQIFSTIEQEWNHYDKYSETIIEGMVIQLFVTALRGQTMTVDTDFITSQKHLPLLDALHYIEHFYADDPSLQQTADAIHISSAYLSHLFTQELGSSYSRFLTEIKLNHAMRLLSYTNLSVTEIAHQSGYQNSNYFCDAFKKVLGVTPLKFRKSKRTPNP